MIVNVPGCIYILNSEDIPPREDLREFFDSLNENDILEIRDAGGGYRHVTRFFLDNNLKFIDLSLPKSDDTYQIASRMCWNDSVMPVMDADHNCVCIIKKIPAYYDHFYKYEGGLDLSFINLYDCICLFKVNEYSIELYKKAIPLWQGKRVYLIGEDWKDFMDVLPEYTHIEVIVLPEMNFEDKKLLDYKIIYVSEFLPQNEDHSRYEKGIMSYDEVMTLTFMFSYVIHPGLKNQDKKFFLIDGFFKIEGIFGIWNKVFTAARYALSKGYCPIFKIISSDANVYSDKEEDDIWNKFFLQPGGYSLEEVHQSYDLTLSPNMNILNIMRFIMDESSNGYEILWPDGIFNHSVRKYIEERQCRFLPYPDRTLGVLVRGTDYVHNPLPNHPKHATLEMIVEKINEVKDEWDFDYLYLATEDEEICMKMKSIYGDSISFTDQQRFIVKPGQLLSELHDEKKEGEGFRLGAEYLCVLNLLSQCSSFIASGSCGGTSEALRENDNKYRHVYIFDNMQR